MNLIEYCKKSNLDISALSQAQIKTLAHGYLAGVNPTQERINMVMDINNGKLTPRQAINNAINKCKKA